jgi:hypothetical protein
MATQDHAIYEAVSPANPGWYTLPTLDRPFPEGLGGLGLGNGDLARWFAYPMTILAGDRDIDTTDENLPRNPEALARRLAALIAEPWARNSLGDAAAETVRRDFDFDRCVRGIGRAFASHMPPAARDTPRAAE